MEIIFSAVPKIKVTIKLDKNNVQNKIAVIKSKEIYFATTTSDLFKGKDAKK